MEDFFLLTFKKQIFCEKDNNILISKDENFLDKSGFKNEEIFEDYEFKIDDLKENYWNVDYFGLSKMLFALRCNCVYLLR